MLEKRKRSDSDLNQTVTELNKLRVSTAEAKHDNENLTRRVAELEEESEVNFTKRKELESKIIVLQTELTEEKKKLVNQSGLEKTLVELRKQIELKTSEVVDLSDLLEKNKGVQEENIRLKELICELEVRLKQLESDNEVANEKFWAQTREVKSIKSANEQDRVRLVELVTANKKIAKELNSSREQFKRKRIELEQKLAESEKKLEESLEEIDTKNSEFENYKSKVFKVFNELKIKNQDLEQKVISFEARERERERVEEDG